MKEEMKEENKPNKKVKEKEEIMKINRNLNNIKKKCQNANTIQENKKY